MRPARLERKLLWGIVAVVVVPTVLVEGTLIVLHRRGAFPDTWALLLAVLVGLPAVMAYLGWIAHALGRSAIGTVQRIQHGAELMATVNPAHRVEVHTGDGLEALARDVNLLADRLRDATGALEGLADGVVVASLEGRITLANSAARRMLDGGAPLAGRNAFDLVDRSRIHRALDELVEGGEGPWSLALALARGGELHATMTALRDAGGRPTGLILALRAAVPAGHGIGEETLPGPARIPFRSAAGAAEAGPKRGISAPAPGARLDELTFVVLDVETTGLRPDAGDRIVSLAGVRVRGGVVGADDAFDALVNPERSIPAASTAVHGITDAMVAGAPPIGEVLPAFLRFAEGTVLVGHEVSFDLAFIRRDAERLGLPALGADRPVLDTRRLSSVVHGAGVEHTLEAVAGRLGVVVVGRHSAIGDARITAEVFVRLLALLERRGLVTLGATLGALRWGRPLPTSRGG